MISILLEFVRVFQKNAAVFATDVAVFASPFCSVLFSSLVQSVKKRVSPGRDKMKLEKMERRTGGIG